VLSPDADGTQEGLIYAACGDNKVHIWDTETEQQVGSLQGHADYVHCVAVTNDGNQVISGGEDGTVRLWGTLPPSAPLEERMRIDFIPRVRPKMPEHASREPCSTLRRVRACR